MRPHAAQPLDYAPPTRAAARVPWIAIGTLVALGGACMLVTLYYGTEEPFGSGSVRDRLILDGAPIVLILGWIAWVLLVWRRVRPRYVMILLLLVGVPAGAFLGSLAWGAHQRFRADVEEERLNQALWRQMAIDEASRREIFTKPAR